MAKQTFAERHDSYLGRGNGPGRKRSNKAPSAKLSPFQLQLLAKATAKPVAKA